jgi:hypothetical protein
MWAMENRTLKGKPYRFNGTKPQQKRAFLRQLLADESQQKTYQKSRQCGVSENSVSEILFLADKYDYKKFMYVFPTHGQMQDFVKTRIEPAIEESPYLKTLITKHKAASVKLKHIKNCDVLFRSGSKASLGEGVDVDGVFFDERDRMSTSILDAFRESLTSSELGYIRDISTPSIPGMGVNLSFEQSDKKHWFVRCTKCGKMQNLSFPESIVKVKVDNRHTFKCKFCGGYDCIDRNDGEWVSEITEVKMPWSGYQVSQLDCSWISADQIIDKKNRMIPQLFFNYVLGKPYIGSNILISQQQLTSSMQRGYDVVSRTGKIVAGVDWGDISWIIIGMITSEEKVLLLHYERMAFSDPEMHHKRVSELLTQFKVDMLVCDAGYGKDRNAELMKRHPGKVWSCVYIPDNSNTRQVENIWNQNLRRVTVNRTVTLKVMARAWTQKEFIYPLSLVMNNPISMVYMSHLKSLAIILEELEENKLWERVGHTGPDHFAHATNYLLIAAYGMMNRPYVSLGFLEGPGSNPSFGKVSI